MVHDSLLSKHGCKLTDRIFQGWAHAKAIGIPIGLLTVFEKQDFVEVETAD